MADNGQVEQDCRCKEQDDLKRLEHQEKDDVGTLSRFGDMSWDAQIVFLIYKVREFTNCKGGEWKEKLEIWTKEYAQCNCERGRWAGLLRGVVKDMKLDKLLSSKSPPFRRFMNEDLREFLNLNEKGTMEYKWEEVCGRDGWIEAPSIGAVHHQYEVLTKDGYHNNAKFVHEDGREVIFNDEKKMVDTYIDRGTFNYVPVETIPGNKTLLYATMISAAVAVMPQVEAAMSQATAAMSQAVTADMPQAAKAMSQVATATILPATAATLSAIAVKDSFRFFYTFEEHDKHDVKPWVELMKKEFYEKLPKTFAKEIYTFSDGKCLFHHMWKENSKIWCFDNKARVKQ